MNYRSIYTLMMLFLLVGCAKPSIIYHKYAPEQIIHHSQINKVDNLSNHVVYLNKGDTIPLKLSLNSELLDISNEVINLVLKQKVYIKLTLPETIAAVDDGSMSEKDRQKYIQNIKIYLSSDGERWAPYTDIKAVEELFGIKGGAVSFGMGITKEDGIQIFLHAATHQR